MVLLKILFKELVHDGVQREYMVYVPNIYESVTFVLNFHGFGTSNYFL